MQFLDGLFGKLLVGFGVGCLMVVSCATDAQVVPSIVAPARLTQPIREDQLVTLVGNVHPLLKQGTDLGPVSAAESTGHLLLLLQRSAAQQQALSEYLADVQNASSPRYHQWLTPTRFGAQFGAAPSDVQTVENWLGSHGLQVERVAVGGNLILFSGSVGQVEQTFHTSIHAFAVNGVHHVGNVSEPQIPAALAPVIAGVTQLHDFHPKSMAKVGVTGTYNSATHRIEPSFTLFSGTTPYLFVDPADAATIYDTPNATLNANYSGTTYDGTGINIGVIGDSNINVSDVTNYRMAFLGETAANANVPTVVVDGDNPGINGDETEALLDTELAGGIAPKAKVYLYTSSDTDLTAGIFDAMGRAVDDNLVSILNISFGGCEAHQGTAGNAFILEMYEQAAAQGISVTVSAGDSGSAACDTDNETQAIAGLAVNSLASTPYNIAAGGTDFDVLPTSFTTYVQDQVGGNYTSGSAPYYRTALKYIPELPWNDSTSVNKAVSSNVDEVIQGATDIIAGGGGASAIYSKPSWQSGLTPSDNARDLPDVSFLAGNGLYSAAWVVCGDGGALTGPDCATQNGQFVQGTTFGGAGGTSAAAPALAGILALVEQATGSRLGQANYVIYQLAKNYYSTVFHDIATGDNSVACKTGTSGCGSNGFMSGYNAGTAYDQSTGLGSLDATALLNNWSKASLASTTTTFNINGSTSALNITHGANLTFNVGVTPSTSTGLVGIIDTANETSGGPQNNGQLTIALASGAGSTSYNGLPGGVYTVYARYGGDSADAASSSTPAISVTVSPEASTTALSIDAYSALGSNPPIALTNIPYGSYVFADAQIYGTAEGLTTTRGLATGSITFADNGTALTTAAIDSSNVASFPTQNSSFYVFPVGSHSVTASYPGDPSYKTSTSTPVTFSVAKGPTGVSLSAASSSITSVVSDTITLLITTSSLGAGPTGTVTLTVNGNTLGSVTSFNTDTTSSGTVASIGTITIEGNQLAAGSNTITATYSGDSNYTGSSNTMVITVAEEGLTMTAGNIAFTADATTGNTASFSVSPTNGYLGVVNLSCAVTSAPANATSPVTCGVTPSANITGTATLYGTLTVNSTAATTGGTYVVTVTGVSAQSSSITATATSTVTVTGNSSPPPAGLALSNSGNITVAPGATTGNTATIMATPSNGFTGTVALVCALTTAPTGAAYLPTCAVTPASVNITGTAAVTATLAVSTTAPVAAAGERQLTRWLMPTGGGVFALALFFGIPARRRRLPGLLGLLALTAVFGVSGCGGGGSANSGASQGTPGTTAGTYVVTVTATASGVSAQTTAVTVVVN